MHVKSGDEAAASDAEVGYSSWVPGQNVIR
jgi:hypothetical protein